MHASALAGHFDFTEALLSAKPELASRLDSFNHPPLHLDGRIPLHLAVMRGRVEVLQELITAESNSDEVFDFRDHLGNTMLHSAVLLKQNREPVAVGEEPRVKATKSGFSSLGMKSVYRKFKNYLKRQSNWVENMQGKLMLVAPLIATISFQVAVSPPGGVWAQDYTDSVGAYNCKVDYGKCVARTAVLAYVYLDLYLLLTIYAMISFTASLGVVLLAISGLPLKNKLCTRLMIIAMVLAISFVFATFETALTLVTLDHIYYTSSNSLKTIKYIWYGLEGIVTAFGLICLLFWFLYKLRFVSDCFSKLLLYLKVEVTSQTDSF
ncbi:hypothetical protein GOBAR_AA39909 [Gossypium barbadense]|uniref:PGG domain-containing protein n=1 Tax=Gossypium barbadense TaxID=3634 RepID=A0A2P5VPS7_GOSBA|nr:hypothetical protein GOBAR_AA39909 [Gossypium barbadense]